MLVRGRGRRSRRSTSGMHVAEDVDLVLRLHAAAGGCATSPAARVAHDHRTRPSAVVAAQGVLRHRARRRWRCATRARCRRWCSRRGRRRSRAAARPAPAAAVAGAALVVTAVATERLARKLTRLRRPRATRGPAGRARAVGAVCADRGRGDPALLAGRGRGGAVLARAPGARCSAIALVEGLVGLVAPPATATRGAARDPVAHLLAHRLDDLGLRRGAVVGRRRAHRTRQPLRPAGPGAPSGSTLAVGLTCQALTNPSGLVRTGDYRCTDCSACCGRRSFGPAAVAERSELPLTGPRMRCGRTRTGSSDAAWVALHCEAAKIGECDVGAATAPTCAGCRARADVAVRGVRSHGTGPGHRRRRELRRRRRAPHAARRTT